MIKWLFPWTFFLPCVASFCACESFGGKASPPHSPHGFAASLLRLPLRERSRRLRRQHLFPKYDQISGRTECNCQVQVTFLYLKYLPSPPASEVGPVSLVIVAPLWSSQSKSSLLSFIQEQKWPENEQLSRKKIKPWNYQNRSYDSTLKLCSKHADVVII